MSAGSVSHSSIGSVSVWIHDLKSGCENAAKQIFDRYFASLRRVARQQLSGFPTRIADDEDFAVTVIETLFQGIRVGRFSNLTDRTHLWGLLVMITRQQIVDHKRWESRDKRDVNKLGDVVDLENVEAFDGEPSPQLLAELKDQQQYLFELLRTDEHRYIAAAKLEGYSSEEIAQAMGISSRTVQRKVTQIYERWSRQLDGPAEP